LGAEKGELVSGDKLRDGGQKRFALIHTGGGETSAKNEKSDQLHLGCCVIRKGK
jgi:hypothetical protein